MALSVYPFVMQSAVVCLVLSLILNFLLLFLLSKTRKIIGNYRYLLIGYSVFLMCFNLIDAIMLPAVHIHKYGFIYLSTGPIRRRPIGLVLAALQSWTQGVCITLLSFNFVFRYSFIQATNIARYWYAWPAVSFLLLCAWGYAENYALANDYFDFYFRQSVLDKYRVDILETGYYAVIYWSENDVSGEKTMYFPSMFCLVVVGICDVSTFFMICFCGFFLYKSVKDATQFASSAMARVNKDLFWTLVLQTIAPFLMVHLPSAVLIVSPFFELCPEGIEEIQPLLLSIFPIVDTLIVLVFFRAFRNTIRELFWPPNTPATNSFNLQQIGRFP